ADRFALAAPVLEGARKRRDLAEVRLLREKAAHLELGVHAFFEPAEDLQHQPLAEDDRVVALLGHRELRLQANRFRAAQTSESLGGRADQRPGAPRRS